jgi:hypothetical protein
LVEIELVSKAKSNPIFASPIGCGFSIRQRRKSRRKALKIPVLHSIVELGL